MSFMSRSLNVGCLSKVKKTCTVSTTACMKLKNENKNQFQLLSPYMGKGNHKALRKDFCIIYIIVQIHMNRLATRN